MTNHDVACVCRVGDAPGAKGCTSRGSGEGVVLEAERGWGGVGQEGR